MRAQIAALGVSVLINAGALVSLDQAWTGKNKTWWIPPSHIFKNRADIALQFVESPQTPVAPTPVESQRISDRNSANRDRTIVKRWRKDAPLLKQKNRNDRLAQRRKITANRPATSPPIPPRVVDAQKRPEEFDEAAQVLSRIRQSSSTASLGEGGLNEITQSEQARSRSRGAQLYGSTSFEATGSGMGVYMKNLKEKIWTAWFPYLMAHYPKDFKAADTLLSIKLNSQGEILDVRLLDSKGSALFDAFCMRSVRRAGPFGPLPSEILPLLGKDELDIKFAFHYW